MNLFDVKNLIQNAKGSLDRPLPNFSGERNTLYDEVHNLLTDVAEVKNFPGRVPTVKEHYDPKYTLKELDEIESRLKTRLNVLTNWLISEKLKSFLAKDLFLQTVEEAEKLAMELGERFHLMGYHEKPKGRVLVKKFRFLFQYAEDKKTYCRLNEETYTLLDKFYTRLWELPNNSLSFPKIHKQYLYPLNKAFMRKYPKLAKEMGRTRLKIRKFLNEARVKKLFHSLPAIEIDFKLPNGEVVRNCRYSPDELMVFIISVFEPKVFYWMDYLELRTENGEKESLTLKKTLSSSSRMVVDKISKPGPKYTANECIIPLTILLKKCFKCSDECKHKHHPSVYQCVADLFNAGRMPGSQGKKDWNSEQIKKRYGRIKKAQGFSEEWWWEYYKNQLAFYSNFHKETGLIELVKKIGA